MAQLSQAHLKAGLPKTVAPHDLVSDGAGRHFRRTTHELTAGVLIQAVFTADYAAPCFGPA